MLEKIETVNLEGEKEHNEKHPDPIPESANDNGDIVLPEKKNAIEILPALNDITMINCAGCGKELPITEESRIVCPHCGINNRLENGLSRKVAPEKNGFKKKDFKDLSPAVKVTIGIAAAVAVIAVIAWFIKRRK